ncbi:MAG: hypothetical protein Faunusvirus23_9 [Faunusvirus sp.]|jgi:hypothetical protein|uniref:BTB domain-containing protein n=1 Tax=Faunusvirus sp. TaxID=2487766 RepID=A0A3G4ZXD8_9VIRU|nr:MAG: hypothetical protein Faunusvirus23_9 [Faunusvirus sp.]
MSEKKETKETPISAMKKLFLSNKGDTTIKLGDESTITVISHILMNKSSAFTRILESNTKESIDCNIDMTVYDKNAVLQFMEYIYTESVTDIDKLDIDTCVALLHLANIFDVPDVYEYLRTTIGKLIKADPFVVIKLFDGDKESEFSEQFYDECIKSVVTHLKTRQIDHGKHMRLCCTHHDDTVAHTNNGSIIEGRYACITTKLKAINTQHKRLHMQDGYIHEGKDATSYNKSFCCMHGDFSKQFDAQTNILNKMFEQLAELNSKICIDIIKQLI